MTALDPCRPFDDDEATDRPPVTRCDQEPAPARNATDLELAIDRALAWSSRHLAAVIRLAALDPYLAAGGAAPIVVARLAVAADALAAGADELAAIVADLRTASGAQR